MNASNAKDYLPLVQALAEGRVIQGKFLDGWQDLNVVSFDMDTCCYRIKPEPVGPDEVWIQQRDGALWAYPEDREGSVRYVRAQE